MNINPDIDLFMLAIINGRDKIVKYILDNDPAFNIQTSMEIPQFKGIDYPFLFPLAILLIKGIKL